ncbi:MAG TPA: hypothetical protein VEK76_02615 [Candidatus Binatia bacterium]|nr:hypothetical protein [Candidatus Binatia bacterium]
MAVYIGVFVVLVLGLLFAYRAMGAPASRPPADLDPGALAAALEEALGLLDTEDPPASSGIHRARRLGSGVAQRVAQADPRPDSEHASALGLLGAAADDCAWAARIMESSAYPGNPGLQAGARALLDHASRCLEAVRAGAAAPSAASRS